ncbi:Metalloprotease family m67c, partial [Globisporangium splendens]
MDTTKQDDVAERLVARRARLQPFCRVDAVKHHLQLQRYYHLARQLYAQSEVYYAQSAYDNAYVFLAKFIKLCSNVIAAHKDYALPAYGKEREWVKRQAEKGGKFFDAILDGMEHEEKEYLEYEREEELQAKEQSVTNTAPAAKTSNLTLEERLEALRRRSTPSSQGAALASSAKTEPARAAVGGTRQAQSQPLPTRIEPSKAPKSKVSYPSIGKPSWISSAQSEQQSHSHIPKPVLSRQRSLDAFEQLSSGKIRKLEIPTNLIVQFTALAAPNTNKYPYGVETCGILAGVLVRALAHSTARCKREVVAAGTLPNVACFVEWTASGHYDTDYPEARDSSKANVLPLVRGYAHTVRLSVHLARGFHEHPSNVHVYSDAMECNWNRYATTHLVDMR